MATIAVASQLTMLEMAKRIDPDGNLASIVEILVRNNAILQDAPMIEANDIWSSRITRRSSLPAGSWRRLNEGVATEISQTEQAIEGIAMLETYAEYDKVQIDNMPNPKAARSAESSAFIEGLSQTLATAIMYGNSAINPEQFTGLAPRLGVLSAAGAQFYNCVGCSGTGSDLSSAYIVQWGENKVHLIYPRGSKTLGVQHEDLGVQTLKDASGKQYQGYRDHYMAYLGLAVKDPRCIARIANCETSGTTNLISDDQLARVINLMPNNGAGAVIYMNGTLYNQLDIAAKNRTNVNYMGDDPYGRPIMGFRGTPIKRVDAIVNTESAIS